MTKQEIIGAAYKNLLKPVLFKIDAEKVHDFFTVAGENLAKTSVTREITKYTFSYQDPKLEKVVDGVKFKNPIGLAAGFDYDGHLAEAMSLVGFGFNTVGTVTAKYYEGNEYPRLGRLPKSKSLLVNKGFKSEGADRVAQRLDKKDLQDKTVGVSVGSSNIPEVDTIAKAIDDYLYTFNLFKNREYVRYFELNISCPNTCMTESFTDSGNLKELLDAVKNVGINKPIYVKMPNEVSLDHSDEMVRLILDAGFNGMIFSNLVKNRENGDFDKKEIEKFLGKKGNFSGKPVSRNSLDLIRHTRNKFGTGFTIIGCGGVFEGKDALEKIESGADLVQLITGMIFEGPQVVGEINSYLFENLRKL